MKPVVVDRRMEADEPPFKDEASLWHNRPVSPLSTWWLARRRLLNGWRLLLVVGLGMLIAVVMISVVPLYTNLLADVQLQSTLASDSPEARNVEIDTPTYASDPAQIDQANTIVRSLGAQYISSITQPDVCNYLTITPLPVIGAGPQAQSIDVLTRAQVMYLSYDYNQAGPHIDLLAGSLPQPTAPGVLPQADITAQMAQNLNLHVGDRIDAVLIRGARPAITVQVVGIWQPRDANDPYWNGRTFLTEPTTDTQPLIFPTLLDRSSLLNIALSLPQIRYSSPLLTQHWVYFTIPSRITTHSLGTLPANLGQLRAGLLPRLSAAYVTNVLVLTHLDADLQQISQQQALLGLPLDMVVAQVVGLALLFVVAMAGLLSESQAVEIASLKSRGASGSQLASIFALQGLLLGALAVLAGSWLAGPLAVALVQAFVPGDTLKAAGVGANYLGQLGGSQAVLAWAAAGALLCVGAVLVVAVRGGPGNMLALRRDQAHVSRQPFWRRYYLDVGLAVLCAAGYLDLSQFGSLATRQELGARAVSPALLAAPGLLLLAGGLLLVRLLPVVAAAGTRLAARARGSVGVLAFTQLASGAGGPTRMVLLLATAVGLALFALTFDTSLARNAADRAAYEVGADMRLVEGAPQTSSRDAAIQAQLAGLPGVQGVTPVLRTTASTPTNQLAEDVDVLAIDPTSWEHVAGLTSWRGDYASQPLSTLMAALRAHQYGASTQDRAGQTNAGDAHHPVWVIVSQSFASTQHLRTGDHFALFLAGAFSQTVSFQVGAVVEDFPTLYPSHAPSGFVVAGLSDCLGAFAVASEHAGTVPGPNEYWLKTGDTASLHTALARTLDQQSAQLALDHYTDRRTIESAIAGNAVQTGVRGLLTAGALAAILLAAVGALIQSALAARLRLTQFAILRTLGMSRGQITAMLLGELLVLYALGLVGGTLLGLILTSTTLPFLQFGDTTTDPSMVGVPPYTLSADPLAIAGLFAALLVALALALLLTARYARRVELGMTLRRSED